MGYEGGRMTKGYGVKKPMKKVKPQPTAYKKVRTASPGLMSRGSRKGGY